MKRTTLTNDRGMLYLAVVLCALVTCLFVVNPTKAHALSLETWPDEKYNMPDSLALPLEYENAEITWHGVEGVCERATYKDRDFIWLSVPVPTGKQKGGFSYSDFLDIDFNNVAAIGDRNLNLRIHIDNLEFTTNREESLGSKALFAAFTPNEPIFQFKSVYDMQFFVDYTVTITWADTGGIVDLPFFQVAGDLDIGTDSMYFNESWTAKDGFDKGFIFEGSILDIKGNTFSTSDDYNYLDPKDMITKVGVVAVSNNGQFSGQFEDGFCASTLAVYSQFSLLNDPQKRFGVDV